MTRFTLTLSPEIESYLKGIATENSLGMNDVIRNAVALHMTAHEAKLRGRHVGSVEDPSKLDTEFVGLL